MNEFLKTILSLSLSGTLLMVALWVLKPLYRNKLSKTWQYYSWLIVIARMLLPFSPQSSPIGTLFGYFNLPVIEQPQETRPFDDAQINVWTNQGDAAAVTPQNPERNTTSGYSKNSFIEDVQAVWILWAIVALGLLIRKITLYQGFLHYIKAGRTEVSSIELLNLLADVQQEMGIKKPMELYVNPMVSSPMLLGFFRPCIVLPIAEGLGKERLTLILRHELTHYKRCDLLYKWLMQLTACLHWFNPFVYGMAREINKGCELACDEALLQTLDAQGKQVYGEVLLNSLTVGRHYENKLASVALTEGASQIKERLSAIMNYRQKSKLALSITLVLTLVFALGGVAVGAYIAPNKTKNDAEIFKTQIKMENSNIFYIFCNDADETDKPNVSSDGIQFVLVYQDRYTSIGPFEDTSNLANEVTAQCESMVKQQYLSAPEMKFVLDTAQLAQARTQIVSQAGGETKKSTMYSQRGYYEGDYIFEAGWNLSEKAAQYYKDKAQYTMPDGSKVNVYFEPSCKHVMQEEKLSNDFKRLVERLYQQYKGTSLPLEQMLLTNIEQIGDSSLVKLAADYYEDGALTKFSAIFPSLDRAVQQKYCDRMIEDGKTAFLAANAANMNEEMIGYCAQETYKEGKIALFSTMVPYMTKAQIQQWTAEASKDDKINFLSVLTNHVKAEANTPAKVNTMEDDQKKESKIVKLSASEPFRFTAGQGPNQAYDYTGNSGNRFSITKGQRVQISNDFITPFHVDPSNERVKLIFQDDEQRIVEVEMGAGEKKAVVFPNTGVYSLTIQNNEDVSMWYSFTLQ